MLIEQIDDLHAHIAQVTGLLDEAMAALPVLTAPAQNATVIDASADAVASAVQRLSAIPGAGPDSVRAVIGGIGLDMSVFGTPPAAVLVAKTSLQTKQSGRKNGRARTGKGNPYLEAALGQMATGAAKTDTILGARYRRLIKRMPKPKALAAIERSILVIIFHMLADPTVEFAELGADHYTQRLDRARRTSQLTANSKPFGYTVTLTTAA